MTRTFPLWVGGEPKGGTSHESIKSPWDGKVVAEVASGTAADLDRAIALAHAVKNQLAKTASSERALWLSRMSAIIKSRQDEIAGEICAEAGKPISLSQAEVERAASTFETAAEEAKRIGGEVLPLDVAAHARGRHGITRRFPRGVVGGIVPFNFPLNLAAHKIAPALAAGAPIVLKPPPQAPGPTLLLAEIARDAGVPPGAVSILLVRVEEAAAFTQDPRIAVLSFTGSTAVGWSLKAKAPEKQVILELGGNAALVVDKTADLAHAAERTAVAGFAYAGQVCIKAQRILVERPVYGEFTRLLDEAIRKKAIAGDPRRNEVLCGPVIDDKAADRITSWVAEATTAGAVQVRPFAREGRLLQPTVLEKVPHTTKVWNEEIFGPVLALQPFDRFDEAIDLVNASRYGLQAGLFTSDLPRALSAFEGFEAGAVILNEAPTFRVDPMPYGGVKASGFGREGLRYAIQEMTELRLLVLPPTL